MVPNTGFFGSDEGYERFLESARLSGRSAHRELEAARRDLHAELRRDSYTAPELQESYGVSADRLRQLRDARGVVSFELPPEVIRRYPRWQFDPQGDVRAYVPDLISVAGACGLNDIDLHLAVTQALDAQRDEFKARKLTPLAPEEEKALLERQGLSSVDEIPEDAVVTHLDRGDIDRLTGQWLSAVVRGWGDIGS